MPRRRRRVIPIKPQPKISEAAAKLAAENQFDFSNVKGSGAQGTITKRDIEKALKSTPKAVQPRGYEEEE